MSRRKAIPSLTRAELLSLMSRVGVLQSVRFFWTKRHQVSWAALTVSVHGAQVSPGLLSHSVYSEPLLLLTAQIGTVAMPHTQAASFALQTSPSSVPLEETQICNRKDDPPLWSARSGFFLLFISNYKLFSYRSFTFSVSAGQIYFSR